MMSARLNKKRKGRNNLNNRERTVTTLTEDPNTPYLIPTPSEEPAGANLMSSPFSVASSSGANQNTISAPAFQIPATFGFGYNVNNVSYMSPLHSNIHHHQQHPQQAPQFFQQPTPPVLPPGQNDLEVLENLKKMIKDGQHEFYRAVPQPAALASIYLGPALPLQATRHLDQPTDGHGPSLYNPQSPSNPTSGEGSNAVPTLDSNKHPRIQSKENWVAQSSVSAPPQIQNNVLFASSPDFPLSTTDPLQFSQSNQASQGSVSRHNDEIGNNSNTNNGPPSAGLKSDTNSRRPSLDAKPPATPNAPKPPELFLPSQRSFRFDLGNSGRPQSPSDNQRPSGDRIGTNEPPYGARTGPGDLPPTQGTMLFDVKEKIPGSSSSNWQHRDIPPALEDQRPRHDLDRPAIRPHNNADGRSNFTDMASRAPGMRGYIDRTRERDRDRNRDSDFRDRRFDYRFDRPRLDNRRHPPDQRHYEPRHPDIPPHRRYDGKPGADDIPPANRHLDSTRPGLPGISVDDRGGRPLTVDDRQTRPPADDSTIPNRAPPSENRPGRVPSNGDHSARPGDDRRGPVEERAHQSPLIAQTPADSEVAKGPANAEDRGGSGPRALPPASSSTGLVPLEDRISMPPPSLQDRLSQSSSVKPENSRPSREASLEERLSHGSAGATADHGQPDDRLARPTHPVPPGVGSDQPRTGPSGGRLADPVRPPPPQDARERSIHSDERPGRAGPGDRYVRPVTPVLQDRGLARSAGYGRSASISREDTRSTIAKASPSPPPGDYRVSRERPDMRPGYRGELDRGYADDRRAEATEYTDNRGPYSRRFSPSAMDIRDRSRSWYPLPLSSPPRGMADIPPYDVDSDRRYPPPPPPPGDRRDWPYSPPQQPPYGERRREWSQSDDDLYWKTHTRRAWERNSVVGDKERFEREGPPSGPPPRSHGWETREERERRTAFGGGLSPSARSSYDGPPPPRPLSSRLTDGYQGPGDDRPYLSQQPQRELDRPRYPGLGLRDNSPSAFSSRVRPRSPSPIGRRPGGGSGVGDDIRPPVKRVRDEAGYPPDYYSPPPPSSSSVLGRESGRRSSVSGDYPPLGGTPPAMSNGNGYYDTRGGPPHSSLSGGAGAGGGSTNGGGLGERDYGTRERGPGMDFGGPASYERPRSPSRLPLAYGRGGYGRGGDPRDERRYNMPPPPSRNG